MAIDEDATVISTIDGMIRAIVDQMHLDDDDPCQPGSAGRGRAPGRVRAAYFAPLLGYWILVAAVTINPQIQWSLAVFGPILALMAWLIVLSSPVGA